MAFYGLPAEDHDKVLEHTRAIVDLYHKNEKTIINVDNMQLAMRSMIF